MSRGGHAVPRWRSARGFVAVRALALVVGLATVTGGVVQASSAAQPSLTTRLTKSLRGNGVSLRSTAAYAVDLRTGKTVYAHNATVPFIPASNEKLPVTWAALLRLGPDFRFRTDVVGVGERRGKSWVGDVVLRGYGDPTLSRPSLATLAATLRARGIREITGHVRGDESFFDLERGAPGWKDGFIGVESPPLSALVVDRGRGWPKLSPPLAAARAFRATLIKQKIRVHGVALLGVAPAESPVLATIWSEPLSTILVYANRYSDNFVAEMLLKRIGATVSETGATATGAAAVMDTMRAAGIPMEGVSIVDGSGLSSLDRLTAAALVGVIEASLRDQSVRAPFLASLAVAARAGTLRDRLYPLQDRLLGKTGTTDLSCTLSGVIDEAIAFAVLENGNPVKSWPARAAQDRFALTLAG